MEITEPALLEYYAYRLAFARLLQALVSAGALTKPDVSHLCEELARKIGSIEVDPSVEGYRSVVADHYLRIDENIV